MAQPEFVPAWLQNGLNGGQTVPRHLQQSGASVLGTGTIYVNPKEQTRMQMQQQQQQAQQAREQAPRVTPLYPGLPGFKSSQLQLQRTQQAHSQTLSPQRSGTARSRTPLPAPASYRDGSASRKNAFSKSASFASSAGAAASSAVPPPAPLSSPVRAGGAQAAGKSRAFAYAHLGSPSAAVPVFDPELPRPIVVVHGTVQQATQRYVERKHRGTSRNVLGGYYTS